MKSSRAVILGVTATAMFSLSALAQGFHHGTILEVDRARGTVIISETQTGTTGSSAGATAQEYKLQEGLLLNALTAGDSVSFRVEEKGGVKTITKLEGH
jgi:hypothetical protein